MTREAHRATAYLTRLVRYLNSQRTHLHGKTLLVQGLCALLPNYVMPELRAAALRAIGFSIGRNSGFFGMPTICGQGNYYDRLQIGNDCWINIGCHLELSAPITIGHHVSIGPEVMLLTGTHEIGTDQRRATTFVAQPITICDGSWLGARSVILPGVTVGQGSVISAGAVVQRNVPPNTIIIGTQGMPLEKWMTLCKPKAHNL
jgi:maltose O-acetyltransferase